MPIIETFGLTKLYGKTVGIKDLNLAVNEGEIFGFLGPNGAGKTTTIRLLMGLLKPTEGNATVLGHDIWRESVIVRRDVGNLPGDIKLYEHMTGEQQLKFLSRFRSKPPVLLGGLTERFEIDLSKKTKHYSKGNKQKLGLIQALMHDPKLLMLDEPTASLDPLMQNEVYRILEEFKSRGATIFFSSHILPEVERICDRVGIVKNGKLITIQNVDELKYKKVRKLEVIFDQPVDPAIFDLPSIADVEKFDNRFRMTVKGGVDQIIKAISQYKIADMSFTHASLEEIFLEFYEQDGPGDS